jgi:hypothetical protein
MFYTIIVSNDGYQKDFWSTSGKGFVALDSNGFPVQFTTPEQALDYLIINYGLNRAVIAGLPSVEGNSETGYIIDES